MSAEPTPEQQRIIRKLTALKVRHDKAVERLDAVEAERGALYLEARAATPPVTFKAIADVFGITEAAVMQKIRRASTSVP